MQWMAGRPSPTTTITNRHTTLWSLDYEYVNGATMAQTNTIMLLTNQQLLDHARNLAHKDPTIGIRVNDSHT